MKEMQPRLHVTTLVWWSVRLAVFAVLLSTAFSVFIPEKVSALTTVPTKMNFQGRLVNAAGVVVPDGTYNMRFRLHTAASSGTLLWTETREVSATTGVTVTNGIFSVRLGDVTTLPASLFASGTLFFEVELPTPASATCATSSCAVWTEGAMTPRNQLSTTAYAFNSETLDGLDSADFSQVGSANTFTAAQTVRVTSATAFQIQNGSSVNLFAANTSTSTVTLGASGNTVTFTASGGLIAAGTARHVKNFRYIPEYAGAVLDATNDPVCVSANAGTMTAGYDLTNLYNYYQWTASGAVTQCFDIVVQVPLPSDFTAWNSSGSPITIALYTSNTSNGTVAVELSDQTGAVINNYTNLTPSSASAWSARNIIPGAGLYSAEGFMTLRIRTASKSDAIVRVGEINFRYLSSF